MGATPESYWREWHRRGSRKGSPPDCTSQPCLRPKSHEGLRPATDDDGDVPGASRAGYLVFVTFIALLAGEFSRGTFRACRCGNRTACG